ncbi:MAG: sensor histidine kinase, partial [Acidobacteria bacterium]|nr:sensor histidine kinase [Acidobacteriota bacterium]
VFIIFGLGGLALALQLLRGVSLSDASVQVIAIVSVGLMMATVDRLRRTIAALRATQHELADVAVSEERNRVARDIHDILGHSLTVITVKAELAGRLIDAEPERAKQEIAEVEDLSRGALADVRATVSGYRGVTITGELANAHQALEAAGIEAVLPGATESVRSKDRELFGWVAREGVTNVIRHSGATRCRISVAADHIYIDDDGVGPGSGNAEGNGLSGLAERAVASGGSIVFGASPLGGTRLGVKL